MKKKSSVDIPSHNLSADGTKEFLAIGGNRTTLNTVEFQALNIFSPFQSDFFAIIMVHRGSIDVKVNMQNHRLEKNQLLTFSPNMIKSLIEISNDCRFTAVLFKPSYLLQQNSMKHQELYDLFGQTRSVVTATDAQAKLLNNLLDVILHRFYETEDLLNRDQTILHSFFAFVFEYASIRQLMDQRGNDQKLSRKEDLVLRFIRLVAQEVKQERSVGHYARKLFITPKYLSETIKEVTGKTASTIIGELLVQEAGSLLSIPGLTILEVSRHFNFPDVSFFGKYFKRYTGASPRKFREKISEPK